MRKSPPQLLQSIGKMFIFNLNCCVFEMSTVLLLLFLKFYFLVMLTVVSHNSLIDVDPWLTCAEVHMSDIQAR